MRYAIRPMRLEDVPQANEIDRECFPTQWPPPSYKRELLFNHLSHHLVAWEVGENPDELIEQREQKGSRPGRFLARVRRLFYADEASPSNQRIVGLVGLRIMGDVAYLTTIGVREAYRRQGIGELLLISAIDLALMRNARVATLEVRASNSAAQALYEKYGFTKTGARQGYYSDNREDAVIMTTDTITSAPFQSQFQRLNRAHAERWGPAQCQID
ncbi:MAG: ribosomal protein S18-alanine N-acetyltransferase [Dehalococcoidia bacterium]|nr:ribosomal protein S18-alanine N-acetyltransferase [Dehalococcoidia bacterium]